MTPFATVIALTLASATLAHGADQRETMLVGKTNIYCVQEPCPWRGIRRADPEAIGPSSLLWSEQTLPALEASDADIHRLEAAWSENKCLVIEGLFIGLTLQVERIVGECLP
jgi:hypothetical protein